MAWLRPHRGVSQQSYRDEIVGQAAISRRFVAGGAPASVWQAADCLLIPEARTMIAVSLNDTFEQSRSTEVRSVRQPV